MKVATKEAGGGSARSVTQPPAVRFLHVFPGFAPGGAEQRISRIINHMGAGGGHGILSINGLTDAEAYLNPECEVQIYKAPPKRGAWRFPVDLWKQIKSISPKVLITYNWGATDAIIGAKLSRFFPVIHNECSVSNVYDPKQWRRNFARRLLLNSCHRVVVPAESLQPVVEKLYGVKPSKTLLIRSGVDVARFRKTADSNLTSGLDESRKVRFGYVGVLRKSKNLPMLLQAFSKVRDLDCELSIYGDGPARSQVEALIRDLELEDAVTLHGHCKHIEQAFAAIDVHVTTSRSEAASNSLLESMACGLPTVTTDIADNRFMLCEENRQFVYQHDDLAGFVSGMSELVTAKSLRQRLGQLNLERVTTEYPISRMFSEFQELWEHTEKLANQRR